MLAISSLLGCRNIALSHSFLILFLCEYFLLYLGVVLVIETKQLLKLLAIS